MTMTILLQAGHSELINIIRLGLSPEAGRLLMADPRYHVAPHAVAGRPFAEAWRNYIKSVLQKGFMYKISQAPDSLIFVSENKTLAGREDRASDGEASGRKMVVAFCATAPCSHWWNVAASHPPRARPPSYKSTGPPAANFDPESPGARLRHTCPL